MIYADYNSSTPLCAAATGWMAKAFEFWGNPNSSHKVGRQANELLELSRRTVAEKLGVAPSELVFTSGGSEANTTVFFGHFFNTLPGPFRLLTTKLEHSSINGTIAFLEPRGTSVEYLNLLPTGELDLDHFREHLKVFRPHLVSIMAANNETGILLPIPEVSAACKELEIPLHTDAVQAFGKVPASHFNVADFISVSAHKVYGPKGIGAMVVRGGRKLVATHFGGSQEVKRRGGTQNMVGIAGFGGACSDLPDEKLLRDIETLRDRFEAIVLESGSDVSIVGRSAKRGPNTTNLRFQGVTAELMLAALDLDGVCISAGSACASGSLTPSHVLTSMGLTPDQAKQCIRVSWGRHTTTQEIDSVASIMLNHVKRIRARRGA